MAIFLEIMTWHGFPPCLVIGTVVPVVPLLLFLGHFFRSTGGDGLHSSESMKIDKRSVFLVSAPQVSARGVLLSQCWHVSSWLEWYLPLMEVSGESLGRSFRPVGSP